MANYRKMNTVPAKRALDQSNVFSSSLDRANPNGETFNQGHFASEEQIRKSMRVAGPPGTRDAPQIPLPVHESDELRGEMNVEIRLTFPVPQVSEANPFVYGMPIFVHGNNTNPNSVHGIRLTDINRFLEIGSDEFHKQMQMLGRDTTTPPPMYANGPESGIRYVVVCAYNMQDTYRMLGLSVSDGFQTDASIRDAASGRVRTASAVKPAAWGPHDSTLAVRGMFDNAQQVYSSAPTTGDFVGFFLIREGTTDRPRMMVTSEKPEAGQMQIKALQLVPYCFPQRTFPHFTKPTRRFMNWVWGNRQYERRTGDRPKYGTLHQGLQSASYYSTLNMPAGTIAASVYGAGVELLSEADGTQSYGVTVGGRCYGDYISVVSRVPVINASEPGHHALKNRFLKDSFTPEYPAALYHILTYGCNYPVGSIRLRRTAEPGPPVDELKAMVSDTNRFRRAMEVCDLQLNFNRY